SRSVGGGGFGAFAQPARRMVAKTTAGSRGELIPDIGYDGRWRMGSATRFRSRRRSPASPGERLARNASPVTSTKKRLTGETWFPPCFAPGRNRTCDLSLRRRTLYPLSYGRRRRLSVPPRLSTSAAAGGLTAAAPGAGLRNQIDRRSDARSADLRALSGRRTL